MRHAIVISVNANLVLKPGNSDAPGKIRQARAQIGGKTEKAENKQKKDGSEGTKPAPPTHARYVSTRPRAHHLPLSRFAVFPIAETAGNFA
jgi:hypothetical protein